MRHLLAASALIGLSLAAVSPAEAKSVWLKCGDKEINLDSTRERYSLSYSNKIYQGSSLFSPGQINFEFMPQLFPGDDGTKITYAIDRKSLAFTKTVFIRILSSNWSESKITDNPETGKCTIMKIAPNSGNQI